MRRSNKQDDGSRGVRNDYMKAYFLGLRLEVAKASRNRAAVKQIERVIKDDYPQGLPARSAWALAAGRGAAKAKWPNKHAGEPSATLA